jgi:serine/threonine protein kinase
VLLDQAQNIKLGDFGLAKELTTDTRLAQTNVGTPFYMSPELINGRPYDEKSDIWSIGCLLYELAALRPPFDATNHLALAVKISAGKFHRIPSKYSDELFDMIRSVLPSMRRRNCVFLLRKCVSFFLSSQVVSPSRTLPQT